MNFYNVNAGIVDQHLPQFAPTEFAGAGGQKRVFKCKHEEKTWALPLILVSDDPAQTLDDDDSNFGLSSDQVIARLQREVAIMGKCVSPHLVKMGPIDVSPIEIENPSMPAWASKRSTVDEELVGIEPATGALSWQFAIRDGAADNVSFTPLWDAVTRTIFISHAYDHFGTQAIRLDENGGMPRRGWSNHKLKVEHGNAVLFGGMLIASHRGDPGFLVAIDAASGKTLWRERLPKATLLHVAELLLILDERGNLHLAQPNREGSGILSSRSLLSEKAWTAPSIVGRMLFIRELSLLLALELP